MLVERLEWNEGNDTNGTALAKNSKKVPPKVLNEQSEMAKKWPKWLKIKLNYAK